MGSPLDLFLLVRGPGGQTLTELDDNPEQVPNQFFFRSLDPPRYRLAVPKDGTYLVRVASHEMEAEGGPRHLYRLRLAPERPDFHLIVMPPSPNAPEVCAVSRGSSQIYTIFVRPTDGFQGEIALSAEGLPAGVVCPPQTMSARLAGRSAGRVGGGERSPGNGRGPGQRHSDDRRQEGGARSSAGDDHLADAAGPEQPNPKSSRPEPGVGRC